MADHQPGQIITPGNQENGPNEPTDKADSEVAVQLSHDQNSTETAAPASPISLPEPVQPQAPIQNEQPAQAPPVSQESTPEVSQAAPVTANDAQYRQQQPSANQPEPEEPDEMEEYYRQNQFQSEYPEQSNYQQSSQTAVSWTASEYIAHHKSPAWFFVLAVVAVLFSVLTYFVTGGDKVSSIVVILVAIIFGFFAARQPKVQQYAIDNNGISIGPKIYHYEQFKSFSVIDDGPFSSIAFMPLKRFMPVISIYYDPKDEDKIVEVLADRLPMEDRGSDLVDRLMRKIRF